MDGSVDMVWWRDIDIAYESNPSCQERVPLSYDHLGITIDAIQVPSPLHPFGVICSYSLDRGIAVVLTKRSVRCSVCFAALLVH